MNERTPSRIHKKNRKNKNKIALRKNHPPRSSTSSLLPESQDKEMVSDSDLVSRLRDILQNSDLDTATPGSIRRQLEEDFGADLSDRKAFISEQIDVFLNTPSQPDEEGEKQENVTRNEEDETENGNDVVLDGAEEEDQEEEEERSKEEEREVTKKRGGFNKLCSLSPQLQDLFGVAELARPQVVKRLWSYIREKDLQDPNNRRNILCDEALHAVFRVKSINMFQMNKSLTKHIWPLDETVKLKVKPEDGDDSESVRDNAMEEDNDQEDEGEENEKRDQKREKDVKKESNGPRKKGGSTKMDGEVKKRGGGFNKLCSLSPQLQDIMGVSELARPEVVKKLWAYIRENNLQDPKNKKTILCDERLRTLFDVDSVDMFQMNKALSKHILPLNGAEAKDNSSQEERGVKQEREDGSDEPEPKEKRQKECENT